MKRLNSTLMGLALLAAGSGCCCDCCNWCNPCRPSGNPCAVPYGGPPAGAYLPSSAPAVGFVAPTTTTAYYGAPIATAAVVPVESLPTY